MKKRKLLKTIIIFDICIAILLGILLFPSFLSTNLGRGLIQKFAKEKNIDQISYGNINLSWFGPQESDNLKLKTDKIYIESEYISIDIPFWKIFKLNSSKNILLSKKVAIKNTKIILTDPAFPEAVLDNLHGTITNNASEQKIFLTGNTTQKNFSGKSNIGKFVVNINNQNQNQIGEIHLLSFPTTVIDNILSFYSFSSKGMINSILGEETNLSGIYNFTGSIGDIDIKLKSSRSNLIGSLYLDKDKITLKKDLIAQLFLTKDLSYYLLKDINPLFINGLSAHNPIGILVKKEGAFCTINPFNISGLNIPRAYIDLGRIRVQNGDNIAPIIGLLKNRMFTDTKEMDIWCTPVKIKVNNSTLYTSRMDALLANSLHICTWGEINLATNKVKMNLGLTSQALKKGFGIEDLPQNYVLRVPIRGTTKKIKIENKKMSAKIAALIAAQIAEKNVPFGDILKIFKNIDTDKDQIPPQEYALPWKR